MKSKNFQAAKAQSAALLAWAQAPETQYADLYSDNSEHVPGITESLGHGRAVELDPGSGSVTILDEAAGVTLTALQTLVLCGFLKEHETIIFTAGYAALESKED